MAEGPLSGLKIVEFAGLGPGPFGSMLLADLGAKVLRIERKEPDGLGVSRPREFNFVLRNRTVVELDLKTPGDKDVVRSLLCGADALIGHAPRLPQPAGCAEVIATWETAPHECERHR